MPTDTQDASWRGMDFYDGVNALAIFMSDLMFDPFVLIQHPLSPEVCTFPPQ